MSWQELRNEYLAKGMVDRVEIVNKEVARVYLRQQPDRSRAAPEYREDLANVPELDGSGAESEASWPSSDGSSQSQKTV